MWGFFVSDLGWMQYQPRTTKPVMFVGTISTSKFQISSHLCPLFKRFWL